jgi:hypothetical protein
MANNHHEKQAMDRQLYRQAMAEQDHASSTKVGSYDV